MKIIKKIVGSIFTATFLIFMIFATYSSNSVKEYNLKTEFIFLNKQGYTFTFDHSSLKNLTITTPNFETKTIQCRGFSTKPKNSNAEYAVVVNVGYPYMVKDDNGKDMNYIGFTNETQGVNFVNMIRNTYKSLKNTSAETDNNINNNSVLNESNINNSDNNKVLSSGVNNVVSNTSNGMFINWKLIKNFFLSILALFLGAQTLLEVLCWKNDMFKNKALDTNSIVNGLLWNRTKNALSEGTISIIKEDIFVKCIVVIVCIVLIVI